MVREMENGTFVWKDQRQLKTGYTTGSCAAGAAEAAAGMLLSGQEIRQILLRTPKQTELCLDVERIVRTENKVVCAVKKDSGDDPDVTDGIYIYAEVTKTEGSGVVLEGGEGVGRVTRKGLEQPVGAPAINKVPRQMILEGVTRQMALHGYQGGMSVVISAPEGKALAARTFNPRLGIKGGISILGTSGIVEPMSEQALLHTIFLEMNMLKENGIRWCYGVPGNYGSEFLRETLQFDGNLCVKCSNYIGELLDMAVRLDMKGVLLVGHIGKLVKVAAGVMNTHSRQADCRMEVLAAHAAMAGADRQCVRRLMDCAVTTEALDILEQEQLLSQVMETVTDRIDFYMRQRAGARLCTGAVIFSKERGILGMTGQAQTLLEQIQAQTL